MTVELSREKRHRSLPEKSGRNKDHGAPNNKTKKESISGVLRARHTLRLSLNRSMSTEKMPVAYCKRFKLNQVSSSIYKASVYNININLKDDRGLRNRSPQ